MHLTVSRVPWYFNFNRIWLKLEKGIFWRSKFWVTPILSVYYYCNLLLHTKQKLENLALASHYMLGTNSVPQDTKARWWIFLFYSAETEDSIVLSFNYFPKKYQCFNFVMRTSKTSMSQSSLAAYFYVTNNIIYYYWKMQMKNC